MTLTIAFTCVLIFLARVTDMMPDTATAPPGDGAFAAGSFGAGEPACGSWQANAVV